MSDTNGTFESDTGGTFGVIYSYKVIVEKIGYKKQEITITVANGETTNLNIELEKS